MLKRKRRAKAEARFPITGVYNNTPIEYVGKTNSELRPELARVQQGIRSALRALTTIRPLLRHVVVRNTVYQLRAVQRSVPETATNEEIAKEISDLCVVMEDACFNLNKLSMCRVPSIEAARFCLTYGQTPKKRELIGKKNDEFYDNTVEKEDGVEDGDGGDN